METTHFKKGASLSFQKKMSFMQNVAWAGQTNVQYLENKEKIPSFLSVVSTPAKMRKFSIQDVEPAFKTFLIIM